MPDAELNQAIRAKESEINTIINIGDEAQTSYGYGYGSGYGSGDGYGDGNGY